MNASGSNLVLLGKGAVMRDLPSGRRDRVLAAIEIPALGIWLGALLGFAFVSAPAAFHVVVPLGAAPFAVLIAASILVLTAWGYVLGGIAIVVALLRSVSAGDRTWDIVRAALIAIALLLATYEQRAIVPEMTSTVDVHSPEYHALHARSTEVYGGVALLVLAALILAAARRPE
jgi:hypothetical protein